MLMLALLSLLYRYRESPRVKRLSSFVLPAIAVLMANLTFNFFSTSIEGISWIPTIMIAVVSYIALERFKIHPALVIVAGLLVGGLFL